ncbi:MAG TPA: hypothetical protein VF623_04845 [Segetibacter sp.]|jgi:hypothetical protein
MKSFNIKKICAEPDRPPYSRKVDEYFETFVYENILKPFDIIINSDWKVVLTIMIFKKELDAPEGINFYEPDVFEDDKIKVFPATINLEDIYKNEDHVENIVGLYFQVISIFFLSRYKKVAQEYMVELMDQIDWKYLLELPYPTLVEEQGYVGK